MDLDKLTNVQKDNALRFLLHRISPETRIALMAELPMAYASMYPTVSPAVILEKVGQSLGIIPASPTRADEL